MMNIELSPELQEFVETRVASGAYNSGGDVIRAAFALLTERERLVSEIDAGKRQLDSGEYTEYDEQSLPEFLKDIEAASRRLATTKRVP